MNYSMGLGIIRYIRALKTFLKFSAFRSSMCFEVPCSHQVNICLIDRCSFLLEVLSYCSTGVSVFRIFHPVKLVGAGCHIQFHLFYQILIASTQGMMAKFGSKDSTFFSLSVRSTWIVVTQLLVGSSMGSTVYCHIFPQTIIISFH